MNSREFGDWLHFAAVAVVSVAASLAVIGIIPANAADVASDSLKFAPNVVKAPGYETPPASYIVANPSSLYSNHSFFSSVAGGELKRGEHVDALAKVKGYEWVLVGKDGTGIGYVSISMLSPADKYIP